MPLKNKNQSKLFNILCFLCDPSISHILAHSFSNITNSFIPFNVSLSNTPPLSHRTIAIIDNDLSEKEKKIFFNYIKKQCPPTITLLTLSKNYVSPLSCHLPNHIDGIIYKPFNIEELSHTIQNIAQHLS